MSTALHMIDLHLDARRLIEFAQLQGINRNRDEDLGYATHAWLQAAFGKLAPKPYRLLASPGQASMRLLGYCDHPAQELHEQAQAFADPLVLAAGNLSRPIPGKTMPVTWRPGLRMGFEVLACPVTRKDSEEKDVYLRRIDQASGDQPTLDREVVYGDWLAHQLADGADLDQIKLQGFQLVRQFRRGRRSAANGKRSTHGITRPQALIRGELTVTDGEAFSAGLARGIGRHRAFGYGMLLLRPAS